MILGRAFPTGGTINRLLSLVVLAGIGLYFGYPTGAAEEREKATAKTSEAKEETAPKKVLSEEERFALLSKKLSGAVLRGKFTIDGKNDPPREEKYSLEKVEKITGENNLWLFEARIQYLTWDVKVPLRIPVEWAGDTPMVSITDFTIPGMGTFTARVLFHEDRYAGTWQHGKVGGHMFGLIERPEPEKPAEKPTEEKKE